MSIQAIRSSAAIDQLAMAQSASATAATSKIGQTTPQKAGGAPPPGGGGGVKPAAGGTTGSSSTSNASTPKIYDEKDTDRDGVVSNMEALMYTLKQTAEETESQPVVSTSQMQSGLSAYQQQGQGANSTLTSLRDFAV